jgi:hypothetical protein
LLVHGQSGQLDVCRDNAVREGIVEVTRFLTQPVPVLLDGVPVRDRRGSIMSHVPGELLPEHFYQWLLPEVVRAAEDWLLGRRYAPALRFTVHSETGSLDFEGRLMGPRPSPPSALSRHAGGRRRGERVVTLSDIEAAAARLRRTSRVSGRLVAAGLHVNRATLYRVLHDAGLTLRDL